MFVQGKSRTIFFPSNTVIYGISRNGSKTFNIGTCEHMILRQLRMGARQAKNAPLFLSAQKWRPEMYLKVVLLTWNFGSSPKIDFFDHFLTF